MIETKARDGSRVEARFRVRLPDGVWIGEVSRRLPNAEFRILSGLRVDDQAVEICEVLANDLDRVGRTIVDHPAILSYRELESARDRAIVKYKTGDTVLNKFGGLASVLPEYPVVVRDGWYEFDLTGTGDEFKHFQAALEELDRAYEIRSTVETKEIPNLLTDRQRTIFDTAYQEGYFDIPRTCNLEELATEFDTCKSNVSQILRRGKTQILTWYLSNSKEGTTQP